jgi:gliding motility-associated-like protein
MGFSLHRLLIVFFFGVGCLRGQIIPSHMEHPTLGTTSWHSFPYGKQPSVESWQAIVQKMSGQSMSSTWELKSTLNDELGQKHLRTSQLFNGIPVELGVVIVHTEAGRILSINGEIVPESKFEGKRILSEAEAFKSALEFVPASKYYWDDSAMNNILRNATQNPDTVYSKKGTLVYCPSELNLAGKHKLCYRFQIFASEPLQGKKVYVDAETGNINAFEELILHTDSKGSAATKYSGTRTITTDSLAPTSFRLREKGRGNGIETYNLKTGTTYGSAVDFTDADNNWNNVNASKDEVATDAHWGAEMTYDYYKSTHGRLSYDNSNAKILSYVHYSSNYDNAFWNGSCMTYGDGSSFKPLTSIDVCGHEITHAVTSNSANLVYSYESGALNESFSDVFGNTIENWARPTQWSWKIGEDITFSGNGLRNMSNPNLFGNPKFYKGVSWYSGAGDNGGVHSNSGVQNYWYYLIANGSKGTNEKGWTFAIDTLGFAKSAKIAYRNLTVYLTKNSQYADARTFSIMSAMDLYGQCSKEVIAVTNAWWVCGVGNKYDSSFVKANFRGDTVVCTTGKLVNFSNLSDNFRTCKWYFGDGDTSALINPTHAYNSFGKFSVKLLARSCFKGGKDSVLKINYIRVDSTFDICNAVLMPKSGTDSANRCKGFIYDDGGEGYYTALIQTNLKIRVPGADSIRYRFLDLDYENGFDSVVLFKNSVSWANKLGRFTGNTIPFAGAWQSFAGNIIWLKHYSDPMLEGRGFKIEYISVRKQLTLEVGNDTTVCLGDSVTIKPVYGGGYSPNFIYKWNTGQTNPTIKVGPLVKTGYSLILKDVCTGKLIKDSLTIDVRNPLKVKIGKDTIVCNGKSVKLSALGSGGLTSSHTFTWDNGLGVGASKTVTPLVTTKYRVILTDGCTPKADTMYQTVYVKPKLLAKIAANSTLVCIGKNVNLNATGSGGDTSGYKYTWNNGLGLGTSKSVTQTDTLLYKVTLTDGCSVLPSADSIIVYTYPALKVTASNDTIICRGSTISLIGASTGGKGSGYAYTWSSGQSTQSISITPTVAGWYKINLSDNCSPSVNDSAFVNLLAPLSISRVSDTILCDGQTLQLNLITAGGRSSSHNVSWTPGTVSGKTPILSPSAGVINYQVILSDGCTVKNDTTKFKIQKLTPLIATINVSPNAVCMGDSITLTLNHSGGKTSSHAWSVDGSPVTYTKLRLQPLAGKTYSMNLQDGCSIAANSSAAVSISPAAAVTLAVDQTAICIGAPVNYTYSSPDAAKLTWYFGPKDSADGTGIPYKKVFTPSGKYSAKAKVVTSLGCTGLFALADVVDVVDYPVANFTANPLVTNIEFPTINFTNGTVGATTYNWTFGDGNVSTAAGPVTNTYSDTGWYFAILNASIAPGCSDSASAWIRIKDVYHIHLPTAFTPDENKINDSYMPRGRGIAKFNMKIFNRWGMKVFETNDMRKGWLGTDAKGSAMRTDEYVVIVEALDTEGFRHIEKGSFILLR